MNKFLKDLERELIKLKVNAKEIVEILADHIEMMEAAKQEGLNEDEISDKFGDPVKVASELHEDTKGNSFDFDLEEVESIAEFDTDDYNFVKAFSSVPNGLDIDISFVSDDFILSDYDGEDIKVFEKGVKDIEDYEILLEDNLFVLKRKNTKRFAISFNFGNSTDFLVLVPKGLKVGDFKYHSVSGDIVINSLSATKTRFKGTSSDIELSNVDLGEASINLVNGDIEICGLKAQFLEVSLVNGDIEIEKAKIKENISFNSVSGDVELRDVECDTAAFKTVSGDVEGVNFYVNEIKYKSVSGDLEIQNEDKSRKINVISKKTLSGDININ